MTTLTERIELIAAHVAEVCSLDKPPSLTTLAKLTTEYSPQNKVSAGGLTQAMRVTAATGKISGHKVLGRLASAWGFSYDWLINDRGEPREKELLALDSAIAEFPWEPGAIAAAQNHRAKGNGQEWNKARWQTFLRDVHAAIQQAAAPTEEKSPTSSLVPLRGKRKTSDDS